MLRFNKMESSSCPLVFPLSPFSSGHGWKRQRKNIPPPRANQPGRPRGPPSPGQSTFRVAKSKVDAPQSPKMDVWSLYATMAAVDPQFEGFPPCTFDYSVILSVLESKAPQSLIEPMGRLHPDCRASAAQMLVKMFDGEGLTTPRSKVPPIEPKAEKATQASPLPAVGSSTPPRARNEGGEPRQRPKAAARPLVVYPPRGPRSRPLASPARPLALTPPVIANRGGNPAQPAVPQPQPIRAHRDGVTKRQTRSPAVKVNALARPPPEGEPSVPEGTA